MSYETNGMTKADLARLLGIRDSEAADLRDRLAKAEAEVTRLRGELEAAKAATATQHKAAEWYREASEHAVAERDAQRSRADAAEKALAVEVAAHEHTLKAQRETAATGVGFREQRDAATQQAEALAAQLIEVKTKAADLTKKLDIWVHASGVRGADGALTVALASQAVDRALSIPDSSAEVLKRRDARVKAEALREAAATLAGELCLDEEGPHPVVDRLRSLASSIEAEGKGTKP